MNSFVGHQCSPKIAIKIHFIQRRKVSKGIHGIALRHHAIALLTELLYCLSG